MIEILLFILGWIISGVLGWVMGTMVDYVFYNAQKIEWKVIPLSCLLGPITIIICFRSLLDHYLDKRKKKRIPKNLKECFIFLNDLLSEEDKKKAIDDPEFGIKVHHSLGRTLRNDWYLWRGGKLKDYFNGLGIHHTDDMTGIIFTSYHRHLNNEDIRLYEQVHFYIDYWEKENVEDEEKEYSKILERNIDPYANYTHRILLKTDKCNWCMDKKATITDGTYVYCSEECKSLFIQNALDARS